MVSTVATTQKMSTFSLLHGIIIAQIAMKMAMKTAMKMAMKSEGFLPRSF